MTISPARGPSRLDLLQGTLDMLILRAVRFEPQHGYGISQAIRANSGDVLRVDTGSLYPALHRMERQEWITSEWKVSENNQRVKIYHLTAGGKKQLASERARWEQLSEAIARALNPRKEESEA